MGAGRMELASDTRDEKAKQLCEESRKEEGLELENGKMGQIDGENGMKKLM